MYAHVCLCVGVPACVAAGWGQQDPSACSPHANAAVFCLLPHRQLVPRLWLLLPPAGAGRPTRYAYISTFEEGRGGLPVFSGIAKVDLQVGGSLVGGMWSRLLLPAFCCHSVERHWWLC